MLHENSAAMIPIPIPEPFLPISPPGQYSSSNNHGGWSLLAIGDSYICFGRSKLDLVARCIEGRDWKWPVGRCTVEVNDLKASNPPDFKPLVDEEDQIQWENNGIGVFTEMCLAHRGAFHFGGEVGVDHKSIEYGDNAKGCSHCQASSGVMGKKFKELQKGWNWHWNGALPKHVSFDTKD
ncbi:hypothetical protein ACH5RR_010734 [Cinchona calisaya]|uniref:Uncharacterized protein n=1 Tax=Cinchona calisaya TaxID=153742 RepID=A0ABD3AJS0_9GENT